MASLLIPRGLCQCGCDQLTSIATKTDRASGAGRVAGQPTSFLPGHYRRARWTPALFWRKVDRSSDCWLWIGTRSAKGYGVIKVNGRMVFAHRIAWMLVHDDLPEGLLVLHHCDNPQCVNPEHLFLGSQADNIADKVKKGRQAKGVKNNHAKLNERAVLEIRSALRHGVAGTVLAARYHVSPTTVSRIGLNRTWEGVA